MTRYTFDVQVVMKGRVSINAANLEEAEQKLYDMEPDEMGLYVDDTFVSEF